MSKEVTPLMQQYRDIKARHQDAILLFRMGDFYEMFYDDAEVGARALGVTLTSRNNGGAAEVPLAGVPVRSLGYYVRRLVRQGFRVAICEQIEDPKTAKGIVKRAVVETITPGAAFADDLLDGSANNFLCAIRAERDGRGDVLGVAAADVSTGELRLAVVTAKDAEALLSRFAPRELLVINGADGLGVTATAPLREEGALVTERDAWEFDPALAREELARHFEVQSLEGLGIGPSLDPAVGAAGALLRYLRELQPAGVPHLQRPVVEHTGTTMPLDEMTRRNLELVESLRAESRGTRAEVSAGTLLGVFDRTLTPMGARLLRQWLLAPLVIREMIEARLAGVAALAHDPLTRATLRSALDGVRDVERLASKTAAARATPREVRALGDSLGRLPQVEEMLRRLGAAGRLADLEARWDACAEIAEDICRTLVREAPAQIGDEPAIAEGIDATLDDLRSLRDGGKDAIARIQTAERARTGIQSLKVGYNKVFGYYIEVTNANRHLVPADFQRRQTVSSGERYVTQALKEYEEKVLTATERIESRERELFDAVRARAGACIARMQQVASVLAELDVLATFAEVAEREGYTRPEITDDFELSIVAGRHPVVERMMPRETFIPNDVHLTDDARMIILTGPNMAGKSTILRQVGLIVLMAQVGSFVPAKRARVGVVDRLFTRVGASDNLVRGQSTFMVEMAETSAILHTATKRSLVLLDEIGRGTSTYDGVSIAWAVSEHIHDAIGCKTIFATHYHELVQLADELVSLRNYNVVVREVGDQVLFLHRLQPGGADRSYGIEVGRLAGLPGPVIARAREVLRVLEGEHLVQTERAQGDRGRKAGGARQAPAETAQLGLFAPMPHPVVERLKTVDANALTPLEALILLADLVRGAKEGS